MSRSASALRRMLGVSLATLGIDSSEVNRSKICWRCALVHSRATCGADCPWTAAVTRSSQEMTSFLNIRDSIQKPRAKPKAKHEHGLHGCDGAGGYIGKDRFANG